jgi:pullulanase/glycogen debranching enzyme
MIAGEKAAESSPLGATGFPQGVNFSLFFRKASDVELLLFDRKRPSDIASHPSEPPGRVHTIRSTGRLTSLPSC